MLVKCADMTVSSKTCALVLLAAVILLMAAGSHAQSSRFTIIDARDGMTKEVAAAYAEAMGANANAPIVKSRIKVIADPRHGFDADAVSLPEHVRQVDVDITLMSRPGGPASAPISLNELIHSKRAPQRIAQSTTIRGR